MKEIPKDQVNRNQINLLYYTKLSVQLGPGLRSKQLIPHPAICLTKTSGLLHWMAFYPITFKEMCSEKTSPTYAVIA